jgi:hypothetical protein
MEAELVLRFGTPRLPFQQHIGCLSFADTKLQRKKSQYKIPPTVPHPVSGHLTLNVPRVADTLLTLHHIVSSSSLPSRVASLNLFPPLCFFHPCCSLSVIHPTTMVCILSLLSLDITFFLTACCFCVDRLPVAAAVAHETQHRRVIPLLVRTLCNVPRRHLL